jgi:hypothetical protein
VLATKRSPANGGADGAKSTIVRLRLASRVKGYADRGAPSMPPASCTGLAMHPDAVMTYDDALITVHHFPAGLDWQPCPRTASSNPQAVNHNEASLASVLNLNVCNSTLFHDPALHWGDGLGQAQNGKQKPRPERGMGRGSQLGNTTGSAVARAAGYAHLTVASRPHCLYLPQMFRMRLSATAV